MFRRAVGLLPFESSPLASSPKFLADRTDMMGAPFRPDVFIKGRPESVAHIRAALDLLEKTFLADGRSWILGSEKGPSAADIQAVFVFKWIISELKTIQKENVSEELFPLTYAWLRRFDQAINEATSAAPKSERLKGDEAAKRVLEASEGQTSDFEFDQADPLGLELGQLVEIWPTDSGANHRDRGELVALTIDQVCIRNNHGILVHFPRWNFRIQAAKKESASAKPKSRSSPLLLLYHPLSPFARKVYMLACELDLADRIKLKTVLVAPIHYPGWSENNDEVAVYNPLIKTPTLVIEDGDQDGIYDSRLICEYLESEAGVKQPSKPNWRLKTLLGLSDGIMDALNLIMYEKKIRAENNIKFEAWIEGQMGKVMRSLDRLELEVSRGTLVVPQDGVCPTTTEIAIASAVGWADINKVQWRGERPGLEKWMRVWQSRESFVKTRPDVDWKTGETVDMGFALEALAGAKQSSKL